LGKINAQREEVARKRAAADDDGKKAVWFKLADGESKKVRFLQELDGDSPNYSEKNDLGFVAVEHTGPGADGWKRRALCTADEGECYPCQKRREDWENWKKPGTRLYINAVVNPGEDDEEVVIIAQGTSAKSITPNLLDYAGETGSITDRVWKIKRDGTGTDTSYTASAFDKKEFDKSVEDYELHDLNKAVRNVPYEDQQAYFEPAGSSRSEGESTEKPKASSDGDFSTW
jgi:hypothetical protein